MKQKILAFSSSRSGNSGYLETALPLIKKLLGEKSLNLVFIPFASVDSYDNYFEKVNDALKSVSHHITMVRPENAKDQIEKCDGIITGGGNTFKLLHDLYTSNVIDSIRNKVDSGTPYIGWSAGSNILGPTIATTNDMPIIEPKSFNALGLLPFQINPHYANYNPEGFNGETRDQRLEEFLKVNPGVAVMGLPEGTCLLKENGLLSFNGNSNGFLFQLANNLLDKQEILSGTDLSFLL